MTRISSTCLWFGVRIASKLKITRDQCQASGRPSMDAAPGWAATLNVRSISCSTSCSWTFLLLLTGQEQEKIGPACSSGAPTTSSPKPSALVISSQDYRQNKVKPTMQPAKTARECGGSEENCGIDGQGGPEGQELGSMEGRGPLP